MKISKELIEKYHLGNCSPEEKAAVEAWLLNDEFDESPLPETIDKYADKRDMWEDISSFIEEDTEKTEKLKEKKISVRRLLKIAASVIFVLTAGAIYYFSFTKNHPAIVAFDNAHDSEIKHLDSGLYTITMAPKSNGKIDLNTGLIDFCGSILLSPKKDIELSLKGRPDKVKLETGETYIVLSGSCPSVQPIIVNEKDIFYLPPVIQKQLIIQFSI